MSAVTMCGVILAGGHSTRMGRNKAVLEVGGQRLIDRLVEGLQQIFPDVMIVADTSPHYENLGVRVVPDLIPEKGALGGILTAIATASQPWVFVMACDMPFFNPGLIRYLVSLTGDWDAVVPYTDDWEPLCAVYAKSCLPHIERQIHSGDLKVARFLPHIRVRRVGMKELAPYDPHGLSLFNMNTPDELARAEQWWRQLLATA